jgi:hypothetical protein
MRRATVLRWRPQAEIEGAPAHLLVGIEQRLGKFALLGTPALDDFGEHRLEFGRKTARLPSTAGR